MIDEAAHVAAIIKDGKAYALTSKGYLISAPITSDGGNLSPD